MRNIIKKFFKRNEKKLNKEQKIIEKKILSSGIDKKALSKLKLLNEIDDSDEVVYKNADFNNIQTDFLSNSNIIHLLSFFSDESRNVFQDYIKNNYTMTFDINNIINIANINHLIDIYNYFRKYNDKILNDNKILLLKINKYLSCNLYVKFEKGILKKCIYSDYDNLYLKRTKIERNELILYKLFYANSSIIICLDIDEETSKIIYKEILFPNGLISNGLLYINILLLTIFCLILYKSYKSYIIDKKLYIDDNINNDLLVNQNLTNEIKEKIINNINKIIFNNNKNLDKIKALYDKNKQKENKLNYYDLQEEIKDYENYNNFENFSDVKKRLEEIFNSKLISDTIKIRYTELNEINYCKFSVVFKDMNNFLIDFYSIKYPLRCYCTNDIITTNNQNSSNYKLCLTFQFNDYNNNKKEENVSLIFTNKEDYDLYNSVLSNIDKIYKEYYEIINDEKILEIFKVIIKEGDIGFTNREIKDYNNFIGKMNKIIKSLNIINKLEYILCLVKYVYIKEYLLSAENYNTIIGGKSKEYQLYIYKNRYFINYNNKKVYLTKNNTYKKNNTLFIKINKSLNLKIKI